MLKDLHNRLRPMNIADILDETIEIFKNNFVLLVGIAAFLYVPIFLFQFILQHFVPFDVKNPHISPAQIIYTLSLYIVFAIIYMVGSMIVTGALTYAISEIFLARKTSIAECYKRITNKKVFLPLLGSNLLVGAIAIGVLSIPMIPIISGFIMLAVSARHGGMIAGGILLALFGLILFIVPIYIMLRLTIVTPTLIVEMPGALASVKRGWNLIKGNILKTFVILLIINIVVGMLSAVVVAPFSLASIPAAMKGSEPSSIVTILAAVLSTLTSTILAPISPIAIILLYYDARIRKEGFDLEILARDLDEKTREFNAYGTSNLPQEQINTTQYSETQQPSSNEPPQ